MDEWSCNSTAIECAREYLKCSGSRADRCSCAVPYTKCMSEGGCLSSDNQVGIARVTAYEMCLQDGCDVGVCDQMAYDLETQDNLRQLSRAGAVRQALQEGNHSASRVLRNGSALGTSSRACQSSTLRCSRSYASCMTRVSNVYEWSPTLVRSGYAGLDQSFEITDAGKSLGWPGMDGSAAARVPVPLPKSLVRP